LVTFDAHFAHFGARDFWRVVAATLAAQGRAEQARHRNMDVRMFPKRLRQQKITGLCCPYSLLLAVLSQRQPLLPLLTTTSITIAAIIRPLSFFVVRILAQAARPHAWPTAAAGSPDRGAASASARADRRRRWAVYSGSPDRRRRWAFGTRSASARASRSWSSRASAPARSSTGGWP